MNSMPKAQYEKKVLCMSLPYRLQAAALRVKPGQREQALALLARARVPRPQRILHPMRRRAERYAEWCRQKGLRLAALAGYEPDEHGSGFRGDYWTIQVLDFQPPWKTAAPPYHDMGGDGMALIAVTRTRNYAKSWAYGPSRATAYFIVGRNEVGTYFAHPVADSKSLADALAWMWQGFDVVERQGDIAIVHGGRSGYIPPLPKGHRLTENGIEHDTHATLRLPRKGERIVVARRSRPFTRGTRD